MFFVFSTLIINVKDGDFTKVFDHLSLNRENEYNGEAFASATFVIGDGGMLNELQIPLWNIYSWLLKDCLSFHDTSLFCLVRQGCQHGTGRISYAEI